MIKYKHILLNTLNLMDKCPLCSKKMGKVYASEKDIFLKLEKTCFKCQTYIEFVFENNELDRSSLICGDLKLEIDYTQKLTFLSQRITEMSTIHMGYVNIYWKLLMESEEELDCDILDLKNIKTKMETMMTFL